MIAKVTLLFSLLFSLASAGLAQLSPNPAPELPLDAIFETNEMPQIGPNEVAVRHLRMPEPKVASERQSVGFRTRPGKGGSKGTLFGIDVEGAHFSFLQGKMTYAKIQFLERQRAVRVPKPEFDKLIAQCIEAVSKKTGVAVVKTVKPELPGATIDFSYRWPKTAFVLKGSYRVEDAVRRVPFQAEYIWLVIE